MTAQRDIVAGVLDEYRLTVRFVALLLVWYSVQLFAVGHLGVDSGAYRWWFTATPALSPGVVFAPLSHALPPNYGHLLSNVAAIAVFGGATESHVSRREYLVFVPIVGVVTTHSQVYYGTVIGTQYSIVGASGVAFALLTFYGFHQLRHHRPRSIARRKAGIATDVYVSAVSLLPTAVLGLLGLQLLGILPSGNAAVVSHLSGAVLGVLFEYCWAEVHGLCGE